MFLVSLLTLTLNTAYGQDAPEPAPTAEVDERAVELYENGKRLFEEANYEAAIIAWEESYKRSEQPLLLFNIASAQERLGRLDEAIANLNRYRAFADASEAESLDRRLTNLERQRAAKQAAAAAKPDLVTTPVTPSPDVPTPKKVPVAGPVLLGVGGGAIVAGAVLGIAATSANTKAGQSCSEGLCLDEGKNALNSARGLALGSDIAVGVGVLAAVAGAGVIVFGGKRTTTTVGLRSVTVSGRF